MKKIDQFPVGYTAKLKHLVTHKDIESFVALSGDDNKLHTDSEFAATTYLKKPVAHGMIGASFISTIIGTQLPGDGALWFSQTLNFVKPVRVGDEITVVATVISKNEREGILELDTTIFNQDDQKCTTGIARVKLVEVEAKAKAPSPENNAEKWFLVTGAAGGIGSEICLELAKQGHNVILQFRSGAVRAKELQDAIKSVGKKTRLVEGDITQQETIDSIQNLIQRDELCLTGIIHSAVVSPYTKSVLELDYKDFEKQLNINLKSFTILVKSLVPFMIKNKYGKIIVLSTQAVDAPTSNMAPYITAKSALVGYSKSLAHELGAKGIRVNIVSPGMTTTELISDVSTKTRLLVESATPLQRLAQPIEIAKSVCFLASEASDYISGETLRINGGQTML